MTGNEAGSPPKSAVVKASSRYWYKGFCVACPVCGSVEEWRELQHTPKPDDPRDRFDYQERYDWCDA